jgi:hypothetical protein
MTEFYEAQGWGLIETTLLGMYAKCLKEMQKPEEYVSVLLKLLRKSATAEHARIRRLGGKDDDTSALQSPLHSAHVDVGGYVSEVAKLAGEISTEITTPMQHLWSDISVDPYPRHLTDTDGFEVGVRMRYLLHDSLPIDRITVKVISAPPMQGRELTLESTSGMVMRKGFVKASVTTNQTIPGRYIVEQLTVHAGKLTFVHEFMARTTPDIPLGFNGLVPNTTAAAAAAIKKTKISFYPPPRGLTGKLQMPKEIHLEKMRMVEIVVFSGENNISKGELRIKSATAGLRLITSSLEVITGANVVVVNAETPGTLGLQDFAAGGEIRLRLPYNSDNELTELMVRLEVDYATEKGQFVFIETLNAPVALPLAVNVQDIFKEHALYSKFQVSTASAEVPLRICTVNLRDSSTFCAEGGQGTSGSMTVFSKQPANFTYKIRRKEGASGPPESLALIIEYTNMDEGMFFLTGCMGGGC